MKLLLSTWLLVIGSAFGQQAALEVTFEVASIKPAAPQAGNQIRIGMQADGSTLRYTNVSLRDCIRVAYGIKEFQVQGPDWLATTRFDIMAKLPNGASEQQIPAMLQTLLSDRFNLVAHMEKREHAVYALVPEKGGAKLKKAEAEASGTAAPPTGARGMAITADQAGAHVRLPSSSLANFADVLSRFTDRPVVDTTGIEGQYDFDLVTSLESVQQHLGGAQPALETSPDIVNSIQRYGLKLNSRKIPMDVLLVDRIDKSPVEN